MTTKYLVVHQNSWGTGATIQEASKVSREQGGRGSRLLTLRFDDEKTTDVKVDALGRVLYNGVLPEKIK